MSPDMRIGKGWEVLLDGKGEPRTVTSIIVSSIFPSGVGVECDGPVDGRVGLENTGTRTGFLDASRITRVPLPFLLRSRLTQPDPDPCVDRIGQ